MIATTGCLGGQVLQALLRNDDAGALAVAGRLQDIFGRENLFVELQDHGIADQQWTNPKLVEIARKVGAPLLVTNDSHYTHQKDAESHDALLCVQTGAKIHDENRFRFHGDQHYLKSAAEMRVLFDEVPEACDNTLWIAERAAGVELAFDQEVLPEFPIPAGQTQDSYLRELDVRGCEGALRLLARVPRARATRVRAGCDPGDGVLGVLPRRVGPRALRAGSGASGSDRGAGAQPARASRTASASSTSTRSVTTCCSNGSSTRAASRCPTSTWTSTAATAAR